MNYYVFVYILSDVSCAIYAITLLCKITLNLGDAFEISWLRYLIESFIFFALSDMVWPFIRIQTTAISVVVLRVFCSISEVALGLVCYTWFVYAEHRLRTGLIINKKRLVFAAIPLFLLCVLVLSSVKTGWTYSIVKGEPYKRGPLFFIQNIIIYFYIVLVIIHAFMKYRVAKTDTEKDICKSIALFAVFPLAASIVQMFILVTPILCLSIFAAILFIYIDLMEGQIFTDALTGLNNRRQAEHYYSSLSSQASRNNAFYLYMLDVDNFKSVNDTWGHAEGDVALDMVAFSLKRIAARFKGFAARYGGDEFMLIIRAANVKEPKVVLQKLNEFLAEKCQDSQTSYQLCISGGWYRCESKGEPFLHAVGKADKTLYIDKRRSRFSRS